MMDDLDKIKKQYKRELIYNYGSLLQASKELGISYHHLVNFLNGRTRLQRFLDHPIWDEAKARIAERKRKMEVEK